MMTQNTRFSRGIERSMQFLYTRKLFAAILIAIYSVAIVMLHDPLVNVSVFVMKKMSIPGYNLFISLLTLTLMISLMIVVFFQLKKHSNQLKIKIILLMFIVSWLVMHYVFLLEMNIEIIHAFAYGGLIYLFYGYFRLYAAAVIFSIPVMLFDEWNQYVNLYPNYNQYWELNDVVLDILGEVFILVVFYALNITSVKSFKPLYKKPEFIFLIVSTLLFIVLSESQVFATHTVYKCERTVFTMCNLPHEGTDWYIHTITKKHYLVLSPKDAMLIIIFICSLLLYWDRKSLPKSDSLDRVLK